MAKEEDKKKKKEESTAQSCTVNNAHPHGGSLCCGTLTAMSEEPALPVIDWYGAAIQGRLLGLLDAIPRKRWAERSAGDVTLLHYACYGDNVTAARVLIAHGIDLDARAQSGVTAAHIASWNAFHRVLGVLCAAGASLRLLDSEEYAPLDHALQSLPGATECVRVLLAHGVRLCSVNQDNRHLITPELVAFERGVLRCRSAVVALLRVKRAGKLASWDKFLLMQIALSTWRLRGSDAWQH